jgi:hypothetical protein
MNTKKKLKDYILKKVVNKSIPVVEEIVSEIFDDIKNSSLSRIKKIQEDYNGKIKTKNVE